MYSAVIEELKQEREKITELLSSNLLTELEILIHKLHGSCCYVGLPKLKKCCNNLENALIESQNEEALQDYADALDIAIEEILTLDESIDIKQAIINASS